MSEPAPTTGPRTPPSTDPTTEPPSGLARLLAAGSWTHEPVTVELGGDGLRVTAAEGSEGSRTTCVRYAAGRSRSALHGG